MPLLPTGNVAHWEINCGMLWVALAALCRDAADKNDASLPQIA